MPLPDLNSYEATPLVALVTLLAVVAAFSVWWHVRRGTTRLALVILIVAMPVLGSVIALIWARRAARSAPSLS